MKGVIHLEQPFKVISDNFAIAGTSAGYVLNYSVDKVNWTAWSESTPANEELIVNGAKEYMWFKLAGNVDENVNAIF